jgi:hypothetical protein
MQLKSTLVFACLLISCATPTTAQESQRELKSGLNYTRVYNKPATEKPQSPQIEKPTPPDTPQVMMAPPSSAEPVPEDTKTRIWNKYKALATGKAATPQTPEAPPAQTQASAAQGMQSKTMKLDQPPLSQQAATAPPAPASGITAILQEWKTSKSQQSEMRSKSFKVPEINTQPED